MAIAASLTATDQKGFVYDMVIRQPGAVSAAHLATITAHYVKPNPNLADHPVMKAIRDRTGTYSKALGPEKLNTVLGAVITAYAADPDLIEALSEVLIFNKAYRAPVRDLDPRPGQGRPPLPDPALEVVRGRGPGRA